MTQSNSCFNVKGYVLKPIELQYLHTYYDVIDTAEFKLRFFRYSFVLGLFKMISNL